MEPNGAPKAIHRLDYRPPDYLIDSIRLEFDLRDPDADGAPTTVTSRLAIKPNHGADRPPPLTLNGRQDVKLAKVCVDGVVWGEDRRQLTPRGLTLEGVPGGSFEVEVVTELAPEGNTTLEGLYKSNGMFCTQCESEGFRAITYSLDRPDVLSKFTVLIRADRGKYPVLLSNGNLVEEGDLEDGRHFALWVDPFPKPCYLFALVAGDLSKLESSFTTMSGKDVALRIFSEPHNIDKVDWAMESLKKAMKWDEDRFGNEYDLNLYNIVCIDDFNAGAMENKSLNVFNSKCILASPATATDYDYFNVMRVVGHEYFHNYTGNRVTCRDWFQLTLKEGLTVCREQEFTSDMTSQAERRIQETRILRAAQFPEDAGPLAHPIRPDSYIKIDNFYTSTVYKKGAAFHRLCLVLLGKEGFRKGMRLYLDKNDGQAVACERFLEAMSESSGKDLSGLERWYSQAGTPHVTVATEYDDAEKTLTMRMKQQTPPTPGQQEKHPVLIPVAVGLLGEDGCDIPLKLKDGSTAADSTVVLELGCAEETYVFVDVPQKPVPSVLRDFSAPVNVTVEGQTEDDLMLMFAHDSDPFNRWDAGQRLWMRLILKLYAAARDSGAGEVGPLDPALQAAGGVPEAHVDALRSILSDAHLDAGFKALAITPPLDDEVMGQVSGGTDPVLLHRVMKYVKVALARELREELLSAFDDCAAASGGSTLYDAKTAGHRALRNVALSYLAALGQDQYYSMAEKLFNDAKNMTDVMGALGAMNGVDHSIRDSMMAQFYDKWKNEHTTILNYHRLVGSSNIPGNVERVRKLTEDEAFDKCNPNCWYTLFFGFMSSAVNFHAADGSGYSFMMDVLLELDTKIGNHYVAGRLTSACFGSLRRMEAGRQGLMAAQLKRMLAAEGVSENVIELASKALKRE